MAIGSKLPNLLFAALMAVVVAGCATTSASGPRARGFLRFEVEPPDAEVDIDEKYSGVVNGWADGVVPVQPGLRRVTLRAPGFITQRFDLEVSAYEEVTLILALEPALELPDEAPEDSPAEPEGARRLPFRARK